MGIFTYTMVDINSPIDPNRLFRALAIDDHNLLPKIVPFVVQSVDVQGEPTSVGCVKQYNIPIPQGVRRPLYARGRTSYEYSKTKIDEIDINKLYIKKTNFEGGPIGDTWEYVIVEDTFERLDNGTRYISVSHYHTKGDFVMPEWQIGMAKEGFKMVINRVVDYLIANPRVYSSTQNPEPVL